MRSDRRGQDLGFSRSLCMQSARRALDSVRNQDSRKSHSASHNRIDAEERRQLLLKCQDNAAALPTSDGSANIHHLLSSKISDCTTASDSDGDPGTLSSQELSDDDSATIMTCVDTIEASRSHNSSALYRLRAKGDAVLSSISVSCSYPSTAPAGLAPACAFIALPASSGELWQEGKTSRGSVGAKISGPRSLTSGLATACAGLRSRASGTELPLKVVLADMPMYDATFTQQPMYVPRFGAGTAPPGLWGGDRT